MKITAYNPEVEHLEKTYLSDSEDSGVTSITVKNNDNFSANDKIMIGRMGQERTEVVTVSALSGETGLTISATDFNHESDDPVYNIEYDQVKFYKASSENGTYNLAATLDVDVDNESLTTVYDDSSATATDYFKISYYNSVDGIETAKSSPIAATGYASTTIGDVIGRAVRRVRDENFSTLSQQTYLDIANEVNDDLITQKRKPYRFLKTSTTLSTTAGQNYVDLGTVTDLWKTNFITYEYTTGGRTRTYPIIPMQYDEWISKYDNEVWTDDDNLIDVAVNDEDNQLMLGPSPATSQSDVITLHYWKKFTEFTDFSDAVETPNTLIYYYKFLAEHYAAKSELDAQFRRLSAKYEQKYSNEIAKMQRASNLDGGTSRSFGGPKGYRRRYYL